MEKIPSFSNFFQLPPPPATERERETFWNLNRGEIFSLLFAARESEYKDLCEVRMCTQSNLFFLSLPLLPPFLLSARDVVMTRECQKWKFTNTLLAIDM